MPNRSFAKTSPASSSRAKQLKVLTQSERISTPSIGKSSARRTPTELGLSALLYISSRLSIVLFLIWKPPESVQSVFSFPN